MRQKDDGNDGDGDRPPNTRESCEFVSMRHEDDNHFIVMLDNLRGMTVVWIRKTSLMIFV